MTHFSGGVLAALNCRAGFFFECCAGKHASTATGVGKLVAKAKGRLDIKFSYVCTALKREATTYARNRDLDRASAALWCSVSGARASSPRIIHYLVSNDLRIPRHHSGRDISRRLLG